jgi:ketosteroid isomerase-like protein
MSEESTTPDPVGLTRLAFEAVNQRDIDAVMSFFAPDAVLDGRAAGGLYEGRVAIRGFLDDWFGSFAELRMRVARSASMVKSISGRDGPSAGRPMASSCD